MTPIELDHNKGLNGAIAGELRAERGRQRITYDQLAESTGIGRRTLIRILNGERAINMSVLEAISEAFNLAPSAIIQAAQEQLGSSADAEVIEFPHLLTNSESKMSEPAGSIWDDVEAAHTETVDAEERTRQREDTP